jgi:hypothetical protein
MARLFPNWLEDRGRRGSRLAKLYELDDFFLRLALLFDHYRERLNSLARNYLLD